MEWNHSTECPLHVLVRMVFLMHCCVTWPCALPSGVKGVSKTNRLILFSRSNLVLRSCSSSEVKYGSTWVIWMWAWSKSREDRFTCVCVCVCVCVGRNRKHDVNSIPYHNLNLMRSYSTHFVPCTPTHLQSHAPHNHMYPHTFHTHSHTHTTYIHIIHSHMQLAFVPPAQG